MTKLTWDVSGPRRFEAGVDRGVLYPESGPGVVWNGLVSVEESFVGGDSSSYYYDGRKYLESVSPTNFQATITAFSAPDEFDAIMGHLSVLPGLILTRQPRSRFGFSYRTLLGDGLGYKIHIVYNALATPTKRGYSSIGDSISASNPSWQIDAVPPASNTHRPTAHFMVDSIKTDANAVASVEAILYGSDRQDPRLPTIQELIDIVGYWAPVLIVPNSSTGLAQLVPGLGDLTPGQTPGIYRAPSTTRLVETATSGIYVLG